MIEAIMLIVVLIGVTMAIIRGLKETEVLSRMITSPWQKVAGMAEFGSWNPATDSNRKQHPNSYNRLFTPKPE